MIKIIDKQDVIFYGMINLIIVSLLLCMVCDVFVDILVEIIYDIVLDVSIVFVLVDELNFWIWQWFQVLVVKVD